MIDEAIRLSKTWVVVPAYNESSALLNVINDLQQVFEGRIILVNDCSTDDTVDLVRPTKAQLISHPINLGQGAALQTGIDYALSKNAEFIITFDSDGQHRINDALLMLSRLQLGECKVVCGSRFLGVKAKNMPLSKLITLKLAILFTRITTGLKVTDAHNGLRVITASAAKLIRIQQNRMAHASEIMAIIKAKKIKYEEAPVEIVYTDYSLNKGQKITNSLNILLDLFIGGFDK